MIMYNILKVILIVIAVVIIAGCFTRNLAPINSLNETREKELDEIISRNEDLKILADICTQLGSLQDFKLLRRSMSTHGEPELYFYFRSDKQFPEASKTFSTFLEQNSWRLLEESRLGKLEYYRKDNLEVNIQYGRIGDAEYGITCAKSPKK